jgi:hypothetical protein
MRLLRWKPRSGHYLLMDPTDEHTRVLLPAYDDNQSYLVCRPEGDTLALSPVTPPGENMMQIRTSGGLAADGTLAATSVLSFGGVNGDAYRGTFAEMKPDDRRHFFEKSLQQIMPGTRLTALRISPDLCGLRSPFLRRPWPLSATAGRLSSCHGSGMTLAW